MDNTIKEVEYKEALNIVYDYYRQRESELAKERLEIVGLVANINDGDFLRKIRLLLELY